MVKPSNVILFPGQRLKARRFSASVSAATPVDKGRPLADTKRSWFALQTVLPRRGSKRVRREEIFTFANQLAVLLNSGVPLVEALTILAVQNPNQHLKSVIADIAADIRAGATFHHSLAKHPQVFPGLMKSMVKAAEIGGNLADILNQTADYLQQQSKVDKKVKSAIVYPRFVFFFFLILLLGIVFGLVPKFQSTFAEFNMELPFPTQMLLTVSQFAIDHLLLETALVASLLVGYKKFRQSEPGALFMDKFRLRVPVAGEIVHKSTLSKFCRTLKMLIASGVSLIDALDIAAATAQNRLFTLAISQVKKSIIEGSSMANAMQPHAVFPPMVVKMISTGERAGSLEEMLKNISDLYDTDVDSRISGLTAILEPALMVALGIVAVAVILALYLPIFKMSSLAY